MLKVLPTIIDLAIKGAENSSDQVPCDIRASSYHRISCEFDGKS